MVIRNLINRAGLGTSSGISAAAAVLSTVLSLIAAIVSWMQASSSHDSAKEARQQIALLKEGLEISHANLSEQKSLVAIARMQARAASRGADASETAAFFAGKYAKSAEDQADAAGRSSNATRTIADTSVKTFRQSEADRIESEEPRLSYATFAHTQYNYGDKIRGLVTFTNRGKNSARDVRSWVNVKYIDGSSFKTPTAPECTAITQYIGELSALNGVSVGSDAPLQEKQDTSRKAGKGIFVAYGAICYSDSRNVVHRADYCVWLGESGYWNNCIGVRRPN